MKKNLTILFLFFIACHIIAQERIVPLRYGDMEQWTVRYIKESKLLGGKTKQLYVLAATDTLRGNQPYDFSKTIWGISNAYANVAGIAKAACTTQPDKRYIPDAPARTHRKRTTHRDLLLPQAKGMESVRTSSR